MKMLPSFSRLWDAAGGQGTEEGVRDALQRLRARLESPGTNLQGQAPPKFPILGCRLGWGAASSRFQLSSLHLLVLQLQTRNPLLQLQIQRRRTVLPDTELGDLLRHLLAHPVLQKRAHALFQERLDPVKEAHAAVAGPRPLAPRALAGCRDSFCHELRKAARRCDQSFLATQSLTSP